MRLCPYAYLPGELMTEFYRLANQYRLTYQTDGSSNATSATFSAFCIKLPGKGLNNVCLGVVVFIHRLVSIRYSKY